jgi:hypothetical protein
MVKESLNRLHPLVKFTCNGNIILQFIEEKVLSEIIDSCGIERIKPGAKVILNNEEYEIEKILIDYSKLMHGDYGYPMNYIGEFDNFNIVINIIVK